MKLQPSNVLLQSFSEMNLAPELMRALEKISIAKPTPIQGQAIPVALQGLDFIAIAQTGSGKTLAFALSVLTNLCKKSDSRALVLAPSREMAQQIHKVFSELCNELPITVGLIIGGLPGAKQASQLKKNPRLIVATPGRMNDHLVTNKLLLQNVEIVVIDEADRMLDMGFVPQIKNILKTMRGPRQTLMFSASFNPKIESIANAFMKQEAMMIRADKAEEPVEKLRQKVLLIDPAGKKDRLLDELNATKSAVIVFTGSQESCEQIGHFLQDYGYETDFIHGALSQGHRNRVVRDFRDGKIRVMVATDLLARGFDVPHVEHVINLDLPFLPEDFLHRIGRTARAGRGGEAITFVTPSDMKMYYKVKVYLQDAKEMKVDPSFAFAAPKSAARFKKTFSRKPASFARPSSQQGRR